MNVVMMLQLSILQFSIPLGSRRGSSKQWKGQDLRITLLTQRIRLLHLSHLANNNAIKTEHRGVRDLAVTIARTQIKEKSTNTRFQNRKSLCYKNLSKN